MEFTGDVKACAILVIEASLDIQVLPSAISLPLDIQRWHDQRVGWFCTVKPDGKTYELLHNVEKFPERIRPWSRKYPDALSLCRAAGVEVTLVETWKEHYDRLFK